MRNVSDIIAKCNDIKVTEFLLPFKTASEEMEGDTYPTIQLVMLWFLNWRNTASLNTVIRSTWFIFGHRQRSC